jgi:hypothetical protein
MKQLESFLSDPLVQFVIFFVVLFGVYDTFKFTLNWVWKQLGGEDED